MRSPAVMDGVGANQASKAEESKLRISIASRSAVASVLAAEAWQAPPGIRCPIGRRVAGPSRQQGDDRQEEGLGDRRKRSRPGFGAVFACAVISLPTSCGPSPSGKSSP